jgi:hypothetical protein
LDVNKSYEDKVYTNPNKLYSYYVLNIRHHQIEIHYCYNTKTSELTSEYQLWFNPRNGVEPLIPMNTSTDYNKFLHKVGKSIYYNKWKMNPNGGFSINNVDKLNENNLN